MPDKVLLIEDSAALSLLLQKRLCADTVAEVFHCDCLSDALVLIQKYKFALAITGLNIPDAPNGEIVDVLQRHNVPAVILTATVDEHARQHYVENRTLDYIVKDGHRTLEVLVETVSRVLNNRHYSILVVDDAKSARADLVAMLKRRNFRVREASSGVEALDVLAQDPAIQLVITDYLMPDIDGYELTRLIRLKRGSDDLRIIGISSSTDRMLSALFLKAGASDFIYRPLVPEELQCRIDNNIETLKQIKRLRELAEQDELTGLPNRRSFFDQANAMLRVFEEQPTLPVRGAVAILDIDHFKRINDSLGHDAGDKALKRLAWIFSDICSQYGHLAARTGGEEFGLLLRGVTKHEAFAFCDTLRLKVEAKGCGDEDGFVPLTVSIGVVEIARGETIGSLLTAADALLYKAKANGRNRVYGAD